MKVAVLALDLAAPVRGRGDEDWVPPPGPPGVDAAAAIELLARALGHEAELLRLRYPDLDRLDDLRCDVAVNLCDGIGRDGYPGIEVVEALGARGIPCAGADRDFLALGLDKAAVRRRLDARGLRVAPGLAVEREEDLRGLAALRPPLVVKPREGGGSVGLGVAATAAEAAALVARAHATYGGLVVEELVAGPELSVAIVGTGAAARVLPPVEVAFADDVPPTARVLGFEDKHAPAREGWWLECPARVAPDRLEDVLRTARAAYDAVGGCGHGRVDLRLADAGPVVLEVNPNPLLEPTLTREEQGLYGTALRAGGVSLAEWLRLLLEDALARGSS